MGNRDWAKLVVVEFLGPFALVFMGVGAIIATQGADGNASLVAVALAHGLGIGLLVSSAGHISGGVYNPALAIGLLVSRRLDLQRAIVYIAAEMAGALAAAGVLVLTYRDLERNAVNLGVPAVGKSFSTFNAFVMEIVLTFFLMFVVFGVAIDHRTGRAVSGLAIGLTITMDILGGGAVSGAAMNPARWFGPAVVQGDFTNLWIWILGPIAGAVAAALLYNNVLLADVAAGAPPSDRIDPEHPRSAGGETEDAAAVRAARSRRAQRRGR